MLGGFFLTTRMHMKNKLIGLCITSILISPFTVKADRIDDIKAMGRAAYCRWAAGYVIEGSLARLRDKPLIFRLMSQEDRNLEKASGEPPTETINLIDGDKWTEQEVLHVERHITEGWRLMDAYIKTHPKLVPADVEPMIGVSVRNCMQREAT
jgi:hypothetical protein